MADQPEEQPVDLTQIDSLASIETARMALRWALERISALEKAAAETGRLAAAQSQSLTQAHREAATLKAAMAQHARQANERERYYAKMEELLSLKLAGKLDIQALLREKEETSQLQGFLLQKQTDLEKEHQARLRELEREREKLTAEKEGQVAAERHKSEEFLRQRLVTHDKEHASRMASLHEVEARLNARESHLAERQARFEEFAQSQRGELEHQAKLFHDEVEDQVRLRTESLEQLLAGRHAFKQNVWDREKSLLLGELNEWQRKATEHTARLLELEKVSADREEAARQSQALAEGEKLRRSELEISVAKRESAFLEESQKSRLAFEALGRELEASRRGLSLQFVQANAALEAQARKLNEEFREVMRERQAHSDADVEALKQGWLADRAKLQEEAGAHETAAAMAEEGLARERGSDGRLAGMRREWQEFLRAREEAWSVERRELAGLLDEREKIIGALRAELAQASGKLLTQENAGLAAREGLKTGLAQEFLKTYSAREGEEINRRRVLEEGLRLEYERRIKALEESLAREKAESDGHLRERDLTIRRLKDDLSREIRKAADLPEVPPGSTT